MWVTPLFAAGSGGTGRSRNRRPCRSHTAGAVRQFADEVLAEIGTTGLNVSQAEQITTQEQQPPL